jgi:hypothetical protein
MKVMRCFSFFIGLWLLGCARPVGIGPGSHDFVVSLPGNYLLSRTSSQEVQITPTAYDKTTPIISDKSGGGRMG